MASNELYTALPESAPIWASRILVMLQSIAPAAFYLKPFCVVFACFWLFYRAYQVLNKRLDDLAGLLGFDIPVTPVIDLASIKADGVIVHWSLPEKQKQKSKFKYEIQLNGVVIGTVSVQESAVTISGLPPGSYNVVRVALVNEQEFASRSEPLRFRTKPASSADFFIAGADGHETDHDGSSDTLPSIRLYRGLKDITPATIEATPMARESSTGLAPKRSVTGRRPSPAALGLDTKQESQPEESEPPEGVETIQQLTEKLDTIRRETDEAERQAKEEDEEESRLKEELTTERDSLRAESLEKDKASKNMKREVNTLERQNTAAQNERSKQERLLQQKKQERQKLKDDVLRWEREAEGMKAEVERIRESKADHLQQIEQEKEALRARQAEEASTMRSLEDEIKDKNAEIKRLERVIKNNSPDGSSDHTEPNLVQQMQQDAEEERQWQMHRAGLQQQYTAVYQKLEAAKRFHTEQIRYLESVRAQRRRDEEVAAAAAQYSSPPPGPDRAIRRGDSQRSRRATSGQSTSDSPRLGNFALSSTGATQGPFASGLTSVGHGMHTTPFFNILNGMTMSANGMPLDSGAEREDMGISDEDREKLTGGAPMSPGAGAELLPADLFSGEEGPKPEHVLPLPGLGSLPGLPGLPGPSPMPSHVQPERERDLGPASPGSTSSRSPSVFASPQASQNNLHLGSPENLSMDPDRRSIRSTRSNRAGTTGTGAPAASSRFSSMFGIKPRTKTVSADEGPALGKTQSHSMPRQDQGLPGLDSATRKRNSSISFGADVLSNDGASDSLAGAEGPIASTPASRRKAFGMGTLFGRDKEGGWPSTFTAFGRRPGSPRPGSTHSNELPRPSFDSSRWGVDTWPSADAAAGARSSPLSFTTGWNLPTAGQPPPPRLYGSRHPSRRPSVQYGASGPPEDIMEDEDSDALDGDVGSPHLAPIGTRPPPGSRRAEKQPESEQGTPVLGEKKLNPAAKDFKSFFGIKSKDRNRTASPAPGEGSSAALRDVDNSDESPPTSRKSRDARSMTTTESSIAESGDTSNDLARTPSYSNSDATGPSPLIGSMSSTGKESFMQKITRKSSSGKFSLPNFKREKSRLDPGTSAAAIPAEEAEEDDISASVGSLKEKESRESKETNRGSARSWSSVLKLGKGRKGGETPSLSGLSLASETEDGELEDE